ncbi:MAG: beta-propeller fold lactonase family protein [Parvularculaceae bacterium]|nr:beta-propeller fold lactonase family protein [Parvularculaceae bacterium]
MTTTIKTSLASAAAALAIIASANATTVYTSSNDAGGNRILVYETQGAGALVARGAVDTGGLGNGGGLGSQGALTLSDNGRILLAVNAGSDSVTTFRVTRKRLQRVGVYPSGGEMPTSIAVKGDLVYVLNAGGSGNVSGFRLEANGVLEPIASSTRPLSSNAAAAAQVGFNRNGDALLVTERATNNIRTFRVEEDGLLAAPVDNASNGGTPFGFEFDRRDTLLVSEAFGGAAGQAALSTYDLDPENFRLEAITGSAGTNQTAACWVIISENGRFAYLTNTGSGTVTGYSLRRDGTARRLDDSGVTGTTGGNPLDGDIKANTLFVLSPRIGQIVSFNVGPNGALTPGAIGAGVSTSAAGLVAW